MNTKRLKQNALMFDHNYLEELKRRYSILRKKYIGMITGFFSMVILSGIIFFASIELYGVPEKTALPVFF